MCAQSLRVQAHMMSARTAQLASTCAWIPAAGNHGSALAIMSVASGSGGASFSCYSYPMCQFKCPTVALALSLNHLQLLHGSDPSFCIQCGIGGCSYTGKSFSSLYSHISTLELSKNEPVTLSRKGNKPLRSNCTPVLHRLSMHCWVWYI